MEEIKRVEVKSPTPMRSALSPRATAPDAAVAGVRDLLTKLGAQSGAIKKALPDVARELLDACRSPKCDAELIERIVARDPFLTAQLVSMSNSAMFAPRVPIRAVREAVVRIGLDAIRDLALAAIMGSTMFRTPGLEQQATAIRRRSLAAACAGRAIAKALASEPELGFMAGLLHDIGELVILEQIANRHLVSPADPAAMAVLEQSINFHHGSVGAAVLRGWKLSVGVIESAERHHNFRGGRYSRAGHIAAVSDLVGSLVLESASTVDPSLMTELGIGAEAIEKRIVPQVQKEYQSLLAHVG